MRAIGVMAVVIVSAACGSAAPVALTSSESPTPSAAARISPAAGPVDTAPTPAATPYAPEPFAVLVDLTSSAQTYTISLVNVQGTVVSQVTDVRQRTPLVTNRGTGVRLPYVSATSDSLYYMDGDSSLMSMRPGGQPVRVAELDIPSGSEGAFAVSPDNSEIAVTVLDFTTFPVRLTLYTDALAGGHKRVIYQSTSNYVWPVAWHAGLLVLAHAYGPFEEDIAKAAPARDNPYSAISYHLVDPANADRKVLMGGCTVSGALSPAGSACIQGGTIGWDGTVSDPWSTHDWGSISSAAALSPDGKWVAATPPTNPAVTAIYRPGGYISTYGDGPGLHDWAGWIDVNTIITGSEGGTWQPQVSNVIQGGIVYPVAAHGFFAAVFPTNIV